MSKEAFLTTLLKGSQFEMVSGIGMLKLPSGAVAKLSLITGNTHGHYDRLLLDIMDLKGGKLDKRSFVFKDELVIAHSSHPNAKQCTKLEVIDHVGWNWYIVEPTKDSIKKMHNSIEKYLSFF